MRVFAALLTTLLAGSLATTHAQQPATAFALPAQPVSCPVSLSVRQRSPTEVVRTGDQAPEALAQRLEISLKPHQYVGAIDSIQISVRGVGNKRQTLPLAVPSDGARTDDLRQNFHLRRTAGTPTLNRSDIRVPGINAVRWIELLSVTYTDGTVWRPAANLPCRTEPNRLLLVADGLTSSR